MQLDTSDPVSFVTALSREFRADRPTRCARVLCCHFNGRKFHGGGGGGGGGRRETEKRSGSQNYCHLPDLLLLAVVYVV